MGIVKAFREATKTRKKSLDKSIGDKPSVMPRKTIGQQAPKSNRKRLTGNRDHAGRRVITNRKNEGRSRRGHRIRYPGAK